MFSFLKDHWVDNYSEGSEEEDADGEKEEIYTRKIPASASSSNLPSMAVSSVSHDSSDTPLPSSSSTITSFSSTTVSQERVKELEEQNSKFINQISDLQRIITTKSSLYLEYKEKYEKSETERVKNAQQSTDVLISMQNEVSKLETEIDRLQNLLKTTNNTSQITFELFKESLEAEKDKECQVLLQRATKAETALLESQRKIQALEEELASLKSTRSDYSDQDTKASNVDASFSAEITPFSKPIQRKRKQSPNLIETRIVEARYIQWASSVYLRESSAMFQQCERIRSVISQMSDQYKSDHKYSASSKNPNSQMASHSPSEYLKSSLEPLKKTVADLEHSFESSRGLAVTLDSRLDSCRSVMYSDILSSIEPYIDLADSIYSTFDFNTLNSVNDTISAINKSIRYRPGETKLQQEAIVDSLGGTFSSEYIHNLRNQAVSLTSYLQEFNEAAMIKCPGLHLFTSSAVPSSSSTSISSSTSAVQDSIEIKSLEEIMEDCFLLHKGNYSYLCDIISTTVVVDDLEVLREFLGILATNDGEKKRVNLPGSHTFSTPAAVRFPRYALLGVRNKLNPNYDAVSYSAGYRDVCIYLRFVESPHPLHILEVRIDIQAYVELAGGIKGGWIQHLFKLSRPLKIFDDPLRTHVGPIEKNSAQAIRDGITHVISMDHFPFSLCGGDHLISALSQSPYCALQEISLHGCGVSDSDLSMLFAVLSLHKRLKVFRASGEREDIRGHLRSFPWDILEAEVNRHNRSAPAPGQVLGFSALQKLDLSFNSLTGPISPYISTILPSLKLLNLDDNGLLGHLPPDLGNLTHLEYLILSRNEFEGPIPSSLGNLIHLKDLQLWRNKLTGSIPPSFGNLKSLLRMNIDSCMLSGPIPEELGNLSTLRELYCFDNRLSGYLSPALFGMVNLQYLGLNGNQLTGPIPNEIGKLRKIRTLFLHENAFIGQIPPEIGFLTELRKLSLRGNRLTGHIPLSFGSLTSLQALSLSENQLTGSIPDDLTKLENLETLSLANNRLTGTLPTFGLHRLTKLRVLDLTKNQITGPLPSDLFLLTHLREIHLSDNCLEGIISQEIGKLTELQHLELSGNKFKGSIPTIEMSRMKSLLTLDLSRNYLIHAEAAQRFLEDRLQSSYINIDNGQRPMAQYD